MSALSWDPGMLRAVSASDLAAYATAKGWRTLRADTKATLLGLGGRDLLVPAASTFADYHRRVLEALVTLAEVERRAVSEVWSDVLVAHVDRVRVRAIDPDYAAGTIQVDEGVALVERTRDLVLAAACAAHEPRPVYHTRKPTPAVDFMRRVLLGQTEVGSYVVSLHAPVPPVLQGVLPGMEAVREEEPFERAATRVLMQSLGALDTAARKAAVSRSFEPFEDALGWGVSANLCEAVVAMYQSTRARQIEVSTSFALARPLDEQVAVPDRVSIARELVDPIRAASAGLRMKRPEGGVEAAGFVVKFEREEGAFLGRVTLYGRVGGSTGARKVRLDGLGPDLYKAAWEAHESGTIVRAVGELRREGRVYTLHGVREIVPDEGALDE